MVGHERLLDTGQALFQVFIDCHSASRRTDGCRVKTTTPWLLGLTEPRITAVQVQDWMQPRQAPLR
jgi:hypothetical protein